MSRLVSVVVYEACYWAVFFLYVIGLSLRVTGRRHVPPRGAVLIVANHQSFLDPVAVGLGIRRHIHYLARKTLFANPVFGLWLRVVNCVPIDQEGVGKDGIRNILARLEAGHPVLVFPEGERSEDGRLHPLRPGIGLLVKRVRVPIVPAGVAGAFDAWPRHRAWPLFAPLFLAPSGRRVAVAYGPPRDPATLDGLSREQVLAVLYDDIAAAVKEAEALRRKNNGGHNPAVLCEKTVTPTASGREGVLAACESPCTSRR
jgi:1-acyl-sn-glycerol-3-phosphate acyltransferase